MTPFDASMLPERTPLSFEGAVEEGLMLAEYASRMRVKNRIVVGALTEPEAFEPSSYLDDARSVLASLSAESTLAAERLARELRAAQQMYGSAEHAHDYQSADASNLKRREAVALALAKRLGERRNDDEYLLGLVEHAREDAWHDVARAVEDSLDRSNIVVDADYEREREQRMALLISEDLARLAGQTAKG